MKNFFLVTFALLFMARTFYGQKKIDTKPDKTQDSTALFNAFKTGKFQGKVRYYFSETDNNNNALTDYYAHAIGTTLKFETNNFHGFQVGIGASFIANIGSSDLAKPDVSTGQMNRYEIGLFDMENTTKKKDINRLDELYIKYTLSKSTLVFGRQIINTPLINPQDGRMNATAVEGLWAEMNDIKKTKIQAGWIYAISPRGTTRWFDIGESIGVYPMGVNVDGSKANFKNNIESKGIGILGITTDLSKNIKIQGWNTWIENISNTLLLQVDLSYPLRNKSAFIGGLQYVHQNALNQGGNIDPSKTYMAENNRANTFGAKIGWKNKRIETTINYNRITEDGRYLMPREWGKDPFFTFLPRERNEGFGDVHAIAGKLGYNLPKMNLKTSLSVGYYKLPDVKNNALNKYGIPSYTQINAEVRYNFKGALQGLEGQLLVVSKLNSGNTYDTDKFVINKVDMTLYNLIFNYNF